MIRPRVKRLFPWATVVTVLIALVPATPSGANVAAPAPAEDWAARYDGPGHGNDWASAVSVSPDGSQVFVTGSSLGTTTASDYATVAYDAATGTKQWQRRYDGPGHGYDWANAVSVSPDGSQVFVTGSSAGTTASDYATLAYDAATGTKQWQRRYDGPAHGGDSGTDLAVSPDGRRVFVTGTSVGSTSSDDYATVAYESSTGAKLWDKRYNGPGDGTDYGTALAVSPDGSSVAVTGSSAAAPASSSFATISYNAVTGDKEWTKRYDSPTTTYDYATALGFSNDGSRLFVTGAPGYATIAYDAASGAELWASLYRPHGSDNEALALAVSPDGSQVFVTGHAYAVGGESDSDDYATVAYEAGTGLEQWTRGYDPQNDHDWATSIGVSPDGSEVYVTGEAFEWPGGDSYTTIAYKASTGGMRWRVSYSGWEDESDAASALVVSPDGSQVFVTGRSSGASFTYDYATVAYRTG
jgi:hypothetical protein